MEVQLQPNLYDVFEKYTNLTVKTSILPANKILPKSIKKCNIQRTNRLTYKSIHAQAETETLHSQFTPTITLLSIIDNRYLFYRSTTLTSRHR